jgi:tripartite-type tricarboxylate transporter receptor subunit TctC
MHRRTLLAAGLAAPAALAQDGPITIIVPFTPGTGIDILARLAAPVLQGALGHAVVVENRAGASGNIGTQAVARAAPDGRTLLMQVNTFVMSPPMFRQAPYDPVAQFAPIIHLTNGDLVLVVNPDVDAADLAAFVALARGRVLDYASPGVGTPQHLAMELFRQVARIPELNHVPYRGSAPAVQDLIARRIAAMVLPVHTALPLAERGQLRMLAVGSPQRIAAAPQLPTFAEAGFAGAEVDLWYGLLGPAGLPEALRARLFGILSAWVRREDTRAQLAAQGMVPVGAEPAGFARLIAADAERWARVVRTANISAE